VLKYFTVEVDSIPFIAYKTNNGIKLRNDNSGYGINNDKIFKNEVSHIVVLDFINRHMKNKVIPQLWVKALWPDGNVPYPGRK
jgi:hypothetical protein